MRQVNYKYNVGDVVQLKMTFAAPSCGLAALAGIKAEIIERRDYNGPCYKLRGYTGFFQEGTIDGVVDHVDGKATVLSNEHVTCMPDNELEKELEILQAELARRKAMQRQDAWQDVVNAIRHYLTTHGNIAIDSHDATIVISATDYLNTDTVGTIYRSE